MTPAARLIMTVGLSVLTGCNSEPSLMAQPPMALAPGYIKMESGKIIQVFGYDLCPDSGYALIGRIESNSEAKHCTLVGKDAQAFEISVGTPVGMVVERWTVVADERSIRLVRPNGDGATVFRNAE